MWRRSHRVKNHNFYSDNPTLKMDETINQSNIEQCFESYAKMDPEELLLTLSDEKHYLQLNSYLQRRNERSSVELFVKCLRILSCAQFDTAKMKILNKIFTSNIKFILTDFIVTEENKVNPREFYKNFFDLLEVIIELSPSIAKATLAPMFQNFEIARRYTDLKSCCVLQQYNDIWMKFTLLNEVSHKTDEKNFRDFAIVPHVENLRSGPTRLEPNIVSGSYRSVEHYLRVQFHLMREDFFTAMRKDIDFLQTTKFIDVNSTSRIFKNTCFVKYKLQHEILVIEVAYNVKNKKRQVGDSQFMFGSLICLCADNFTTQLFFTVNHHDVKKRKVSLVPLTNEPVTKEMFSKSFVMIECLAFFPSYLNIMRHLQNYDLAKNFPFEDYIVHTQQRNHPPKYLKNILEYTLLDGTIVKVDDLENLEWTPRYIMNKSQFDAYKMALCREFVIIQGPPGTGKTFVALKIAATFLRNFYLKNNRILMTPILVVCCTNNALDHFLEGLLDFTEKIVRIGAQSKSTLLEDYNIKDLRRLYSNIPRHDLKNNASELKNIIRNLETIDAYGFIIDFSCGSISREYLSIDLKQFFENYKSVQRPAIVDWLLCNDSIKQVCHSNGNQNNWEFAIEEVEDMIELKKLKTRLSRGNRGYSKVTNFNSSYDPKSYNSEERWSLYWEWLDIAKAVLLSQFSAAMETNKFEHIIIDELRQVADLKIVQNKHIVGMTTSAAARLQPFLRALRPSIVIVDEASQVLETHILASLTKHCEHLIMIGDHQQLKPHTVTWEMSKYYLLDVSLFERMVNNGAHCTTLNVQHRMRPEIASLITPSIYKVLKNHDSVTGYPNVGGVKSNLFFINHTEEEIKVQGDSSKKNLHEVNFFLAFARYLTFQGYLTCEITIISPYACQVSAFIKVRKSMPDLKDLKIINIDQYQGEENRIILLSLVRSNRRGDVGFLDNNNRICVALSRAKEGFYMMGNMNILKKESKLWRSINKNLTNCRGIGPNLILQCQIHRDKFTSVRNAIDFSKVQEGGCGLPCKILLKCGHPCPKPCHLNSSHREEKCEKNCSSTAHPQKKKSRSKPSFKRIR